MLRSDAPELFRTVHDRHAGVVFVGSSLGSSLANQLAAEGQVFSLVFIAPFESILEIVHRTERRRSCR